jgi:hypothetical protein
MAFSASASSLISANPNPRGWPVKRSRSRVRESGCTPASANNAATSSSVALNDRLPTYSFFTLVLLAPPHCKRAPTARLKRQFSARRGPPTRPAPPAEASTPATGTSWCNRPSQSSMVGGRRGSYEGKSKARRQSGDWRSRRRTVVGCAQLLPGGKTHARDDDGFSADARADS